MTPKFFEIRDIGTFIPILAIDLETDVPAERYLLNRSGYYASSRADGFQPTILLIKLSNGQLSNHPADWGDTRTMPTAHSYIADNFYTLESGAVIDVEFILKEKEVPKQSERYTATQF